MTWSGTHTESQQQQRICKKNTWNGFYLSLRFQFLQGQKSCQHYETTFSIMLSHLLSCSGQKKITVKLEDMSHGRPCSNDSWEPGFSILPSLFHIIYRTRQPGCPYWTFQKGKSSGIFPSLLKKSKYFWFATTNLCF